MLTPAPSVPTLHIYYPSSDVKQFITKSANVQRGWVSASAARVNAGGSQPAQQGWAGLSTFLVIFGAGDVYTQWTEQGDSEWHGRTPKKESGCATDLVNGRRIRCSPSTDGRPIEPPAEPHGSIGLKRKPTWTSRNSRKNVCATRNTRNTREKRRIGTSHIRTHPSRTNFLD